MSICHLQGNGAYDPITINSNALPAHEAHGDLPVGAAIPGGGGATLDSDCVPQTIDVTGTYTLRTLGGETLPALGTGELIHSMTIVLNEGGSCSVSGWYQGAQEDPDGLVEYFAFDSCSYSLEGTELRLVLGSEEDEDTVTAELVGDEITLHIRIWDEAEGTTEEDAPFGDAVFVKV